MRRRFIKMMITVLSLSLLLTLVAACGTSDPEGTETGTTTTADNGDQNNGNTGDDDQSEAEDVTIQFWNGFTASDGDILREIFDRFNETNNKGINVEMDIMPWGNMLEKLAPAISTNTGPAMILLGSETIPEYAASGGLVPLDDFWSWSELDESNYLENVRQTFVYEETTYGIPMQYNTMFLYWNKDLFEEAGLDPEQPPENFTQLKEYAAAMTDASKEQYGFGIALGHGNITNFLWSNGADWLNGDMTQAAVNSPESIEVLTMLQNFASDGVTPIGMTGAELDNLLYAGQLGLYINGPWLINGLRQNEVNFGIGAVPAADDGHLQVPGGGVAFMVTSSADEAEKEAAYEAIKYWLSKDVLKEWTLRNGFPAWSEEVLADEEVMNDEIQNVIGPLLEFGRLPFPGMPAYGQISSDYLDPLFEQLMYGEITPEEAAEQMEAGINMILGQ